MENEVRGGPLYPIRLQVKGHLNEEKSHLRPDHVNLYQAFGSSGLKIWHQVFHNGEDRAFETIFDWNKPVNTLKYHFSATNQSFGSEIIITLVEIILPAFTCKRNLVPRSICPNGLRMIGRHRYLASVANALERGNG